MKKPIIFAVDDDPQVLQAVVRDLRSQYRKDYRILSTISANEALDNLVELKKKGEEVAFFLSDQKMPEMEGVDYLEKAKEYYPKAKRVLLTAYSDTDAAIKAINDVQLDYYLMKPWDPPEERFFPVINDQLEEWQASYRPAFDGIRVIGYQFSPKSHKIKDFLAGNLFPYEWLDIETSATAQELLELHNIDLKDLPAVVFEDGSYLLGDEVPAIAEKIGLNPKASSSMYDVTIIGAGPAGLAAGVYGGSEGLSTLLVERRAPGGQAGTSSRIENYLGFPQGVSGAELSRRAITQATRFGIEFLSPQEVVAIELKDNYKIIKLADGSTINTLSVVITSGVDYRKLEGKGIADFTGAGIYYGAATTEAASCKDKQIFVVGGGNSAGQAAMYLAKFANKVNILIRRDDLTSSMSSYLIDQIGGMQNIEVIGKTVVISAEGNDRLTHITTQNLETKEETRHDAGGLFIFIGARPYTDWIPADIVKDPKGFVMTGKDLMTDEAFKKSWKLERDPYLLETSIPGIFAAGDVRSGAMNRVASAVGEGAMSISLVHEYLDEV